MWPNKIDSTKMGITGTGDINVAVANEFKLHFSHHLCSNKMHLLQYVVNIYDTCIIDVTAKRYKKGQHIFIAIPWTDKTYITITSSGESVGVYSISVYWSLQQSRTINYMPSMLGTNCQHKY